MEEELQALKKVLEGPDAPDAIITALTRLEAMAMTVALIEASQIGQSVGKLRRHSNAQIADTSKRIVNSWRALLKPAAAAAATSSPASSQGSQAAAAAASPAPLKRSSSEVNSESDTKKAKGEAKSEEGEKKKEKPAPKEVKKEKDKTAPLVRVAL